MEKPDGEILRFQSIEEPTWEPEPDTDLFFSNYELQVVGFMTVANRLCVVINLYNKNTGQLVWKYAMDAETKLILWSFKYGRNGGIVFANEVLEVDYNPPDISHLNLDDFPVFNVTTYHFPLNQADFLARVPWITLDDLPLPEGYRIVGFSEAFPSQ